MKTLLGTLVMITALAVVPMEARAQAQDKAPVPTGPDAVQPVQPDSPPPAQPPPPPPAVRPNPPSQPPQPPAQQKPSDTGQWVHTAQYGWVWMPYGETYAHVPPDGGTPSMYVYYPEAGWCWVVAPWLWGWGPMPYFGLMGPRFYGWYGVGFGHWYGYAGPYAHWGWSGRAYWHGGRWNGVDRFYGGRGGAYGGHGAYGGAGRGAAPGGGGHSRGLTPGWRR
jgi:hypothetical protein